MLKGAETPLLLNWRASSILEIYKIVQKLVNGTAQVTFRMVKEDFISKQNGLWNIISHLF